MKDESGKEIMKYIFFFFSVKLFLFYSHTDISKKPVNLKCIFQVSIFIFFLPGEGINDKCAILCGTKKIC